MTDAHSPPLARLHAAFFRAASFVRPAGVGLLAPDGVVLQGAAHDKPLVQQLAPSAEAPESQFGASVHAWTDLLRQSKLRGKRWKLVVADAWLRPLALSLPGGRPEDSAIERVVHAHYRKTYGEGMQAWTWCWDYQDQHVTAAAWPSAPLQAVRTAIAQSAGVLVSAKPLSVEACTPAFAGEGSGWLVLLHRHTVSIVQQEAGVWRQWSVSATGPDPFADVPLLLARLAARNQDVNRNAVLMVMGLSASGNALVQALQDKGWTVRLQASATVADSVGVRLGRLLGQGATA